MNKKLLYQIYMNMYNTHTNIEKWRLSNRKQANAEKYQKMTPVHM